MYLDPIVPEGIVPKKWPFEVKQPGFLSLSGYDEPKLPTIPPSVSDAKISASEVRYVQEAKFQNSF